MNISTSRLKTYKACKRLYYFKYVEELESVQTISTLEDGKSYHSMIEELYNTGNVDVDINNPKISAMALAYQKHIYPKFKVVAAEQSFEYELFADHKLVGRYDGVAEDGCVVEHKTTSHDVDDEYIYDLQWDEQILNYMLASGKNKIYYTVCKKPTIRQKQNETAEDFLQRCIEWFEVDTDLKIRVLCVERNQKEIDEQKKHLVFIINQIVTEQMTEKVYNNSGMTNYYRNHSHCTTYGRRCQFASICLEYDPKIEYIEFKKKEKEETKTEVF